MDYLNSPVRRIGGIPITANAMRAGITLTAILTTLGIEVGLVRVSTGLVFALGLIVLTLVGLRNRPNTRLCLAAVTTTLLPGLLLLTGGGSWAVYSAARATSLMGLVWAAVLPFWGTSTNGFDRFATRAGPNATRLAIVGLLVAALAMHAGLRNAYPFVLDESLYLVQASSLLSGLKNLPVEHGLEPLWQVRQTFVRDGYLLGQYPPGWPVVLAGFTTLGIQAYAGLTMYVISLIGVARLARLFQVEWDFTLLGVLLTGLCSRYYDIVDSYFAHGLSAVLCLGAAIAAVKASRRSGSSGWSLWVASGFLVALIVTARPLTGAVGGIALIWWVGAVQWRSRRVAASIFFVTAGGIWPGLGLAYYNTQSTGHALRFGYDLAHGGLQALGFGQRGVVWFDAHGRPFERVVDFAAIDGAQQFIYSLGEAAMAYWPGGLLVVLLAVLLHEKERLNWKVWMPFMLLPMAYACYFISAVRFLSESIPLAMVGTVILASRLCGTTIQLNRTVCWVTVLLTFAIEAPRVVRLIPVRAGQEAYFTLLEGEHRRHEALLVFVGQDRPNPAGGIEPGLEALFSLNSGAGDIVVVRDVPSLREAMMERYPDHTPMILTSGQDDHASLWGTPRMEVLSTAQRTPRR